MIDHIIKKRSAVYPKEYVDKPISKETILELLELANRAPNHRKTEPWRFRVFHGNESLASLSAYLGEDYRSQLKEGEFSEFRFNKISRKPLQSGAVIAIIMHRDEEERVPEWEEIAAVAMAVQNIWLACTERNIGCYWSSPSSMTQRSSSFLSLNEQEKCLGLLYMGYVNELLDKDKVIGDISEKIYWM